MRKEALQSAHASQKAAAHPLNSRLMYECIGVALHSKTVEEGARSPVDGRHVDYAAENAKRAAARMGLGSLFNSFDSGSQRLKTSMGLPSSPPPSQPAEPSVFGTRGDRFPPAGNRSTEIPPQNQEIPSNGEEPQKSPRADHSSAAQGSFQNNVSPPLQKSGHRSQEQSTSMPSTSPPPYQADIAQSLPWDHDPPKSTENHDKAALQSNAAVPTSQGISQRSSPQEQPPSHPQGSGAASLSSAEDMKQSEKPKPRSGFSAAAASDLHFSSHVPETSAQQPATSDLTESSRTAQNRSDSPASDARQQTTGPKQSQALDRKPDLGSTMDDSHTRNAYHRGSQPNDMTREAHHQLSLQQRGTSQSQNFDYGTGQTTTSVSYEDSDDEGHAPNSREVSREPRVSPGYENEADVHNGIDTKPPATLPAQPIESGLFKVTYEDEAGAQSLRTF